MSLIFTGGTIAMKVDEDLHGAIPSLSPSDIVSTISGIDEFDNLIVHEFSRKPSPAITNHDMSLIADQVTLFLKRDDVCGVVVCGVDVCGLD